MKSAKEYFRDFGRQILAILSQVLARIILIKTIGNIGIGGGQKLASIMHTGGVVRAHSGYLASDEVPIIAQAGEGIISRKGMSRLGAGNLQRLNRGGDPVNGGGVTISINPVIQAWDASDIQRNKNTLTAIIGEAIKGNSDIRRIIQAYA
jgi:hypothetical protein